MAPGGSDYSRLLFFMLMLSLIGDVLEIELPVPPSNQPASRSRQQLIFGLCLHLTVVAHNSIYYCLRFFFSKQGWVKPEYL